MSVTISVVIHSHNVFQTHPSRAITNTGTHTQTHRDTDTHICMNIFTTPNWWHRNDGVRVDCLDENLCTVQWIAISITATLLHCYVYVKPQNDMQSLPMCFVEPCWARTKTAIYIWNPFVWTWIFLYCQFNAYGCCIYYYTSNTYITFITGSEFGQNSFASPSPFCMITKPSTKRTKYTLQFVFTHLHSYTNTFYSLSLSLFPDFIIIFHFRNWVGNGISTYSHRFFFFSTLFLLLSLSLCVRLCYSKNIQTTNATIIGLQRAEKI